MQGYAYRPLPVPPADQLPADYMGDNMSPDILRLPNPHVYPYAYAYPAVNARRPPAVAAPLSTLPGGTLLHKGFYDLLALLPATPSPSRFLWGYGQTEEPVAGPRYESILPSSSVRDGAISTSPPNPVSPKKLRGRRISKDMVSKPMNFMSVSHTQHAYTSRTMISLPHCQAFGACFRRRSSGSLVDQMGTRRHG